MNANPTLTIIAVLCLGSASAVLAQNKQGGLKERVLAQAQAMSLDDYAFTRTVRTEQTSGGKAEQKVTVEKFDPTRPAEGRWALVSVDGAAPSEDALKSFQADSAKRRVPGYARLAGYFGTPATASTDSRGRTLLHFATLPKDTLKVMDSDVSQSATAEASVTEENGEPFVEQVRITGGPTRLKLLFKLEHFESITRYRLGPDGKPIPIEQTSDISGSGMGREGHVHSVATYSDYRAVSRRR